MFKLLQMIPIRRSYDWLRSTPTFYRPSTIDFTIKHHIGRRLSRSLIHEFSNGKSDNTEYKPPTQYKDLAVTEKISENDQIEWVNLKMNELKLRHEFQKCTKGDFELLRTNSLLFIDRSLFILKLFGGLQDADCILITHPRRTGKSVNLRMIQEFCELQVDSNGKHDGDKQKEKQELFIGNDNGLNPLKIAEYCSEKSSLLFKDFGQYPVIYLNLQSIRGSTIKDVQSYLKKELSEQFKQKKYLLQSLGKQDSGLFNQYIERTIEESDITYGLKVLCNHLFKFHQRQVVVLVDEYDRYINSLLEQPTVDYSFINLVASEISGMLNEVGKDQKSIKKLVITGIFDSLVKEGNSGFNNLENLGVTNYNTDGFYGLTEEQVKEKVTLIVDPDQDKYDEKINLLIKLIKSYYNGYQGHDIKYYNIWSLYTYLDQISNAYQHKKPILKPSSFWTKSGFSSILSSFLEQELDFRLKEKLINIAFGESQRLEYMESDVNILKKLPIDYENQQKLYSYILLNSGYITRSQPFSDVLENNQFRIPNGELREEFTKIVKYNLSDSLGVVPDQELGKIFISRNESQIQAKLQKYLQVAVRFRDNLKKSAQNLEPTAQNPEVYKIEASDSPKLTSEKYYHIIMVGFLYGMKEYYGINSELEAGLGYADFILFPKHSIDKHAFILQLKLGPKINSKETNPQEKLLEPVNDAIAQIKQNNYEAFILKNGFKNFSYVGIAFSGKNVRIKIEDHLTNE